MRACLFFLLLFVAPGLARPEDADAFWAAQFVHIDREVARVANAAQSGAQMYFVGFAGFGEQRVFAEEIALADSRIAQRYQSADRSIRLINDRRDLTTYPLATAPSLDHTLAALGKVMDEDDVLFLALSSHGYKGAALSVTNTGMEDSALDADELADMLRDSGIRWKVIVISACYAGGFIDELADNHTIVLTAASRSRTSFGCSDDRDLTYFGEAFYRDSLPGARSLRAAFEAARREIMRRERRERFTPSQPQAYFGPLMEAKLDEIEKRTAAPPAPPGK
ncbi:MAG: C13 family peptidase [Pseudomonadota bacterium]